MRRLPMQQMGDDALGAITGNWYSAQLEFEGNKKFSDKKLRKKITSKTGATADERKLFTDTQEILKLYQKASMPRTEVKYVLSVDEAAGRGTATFEIKGLESDFEYL